MAKVLIGNVYPTDEYLLERCAPSGYGLGSKSGRSVLFSEINSAKECGLWSIWGDEGEKTVNGITFSYAKMLVIPLDVNAVTQILFPIGEPNRVLIRDCIDSVWGEWECGNPPMMPGVEYRTTETWYGVPVYTTLLEVGNLNDAKNVVATGVSARRIIRHHGYIEAYSLPYIDGTLDGENSAWVNAVSKDGQIELTFHVGSALRGKVAAVQLWYVKV